MFKKISGRYDELHNKTISEESFKQSWQSYFGMLKHCQGHKVEKEIVALISGFPPEFIRLGRAGMTKEKIASLPPVACLPAGRLAMTIKIC